MIKLETENPLLLAEREKAKKYLMEEVLAESPHINDILDDLINLSESIFPENEINEKNIELAYSKIYSDNLRLALPEHLLKIKNNLRIIK